MPLKLKQWPTDIWFADNMEWTNNLSASEWDLKLTTLNGHPLQSALWGESRKQIDGYDSLYLMCTQDKTPVFMARVETRSLPLLGAVAWIPRGPSLAPGASYTKLIAPCHDQLRQRGYALVISDLYAKNPDDAPDTGVRTIWLELAQGVDTLKKRIDKQWLYGSRRAAREGVEVRCASNREEVKTFFNMCLGISRDKGFELPGSEALMQLLLRRSDAPNQEMRLFLALYEGKIGAGAFVARSGQHAHYFWGAADRALSRQRVGEAVQWAVIEWAASCGCTRYDLEGIDPVNNPGVYAFKRKMGGDEVVLCGKSVQPLNLRGKLIGLAGRMTGRI